MNNTIFKTSTAAALCILTATAYAQATPDGTSASPSQSPMSQSPMQQGTGGSNEMGGSGSTSSGLTSGSMSDDRSMDGDLSMNHDSSSRTSLDQMSPGPRGSTDINSSGSTMQRDSTSSTPSMQQGSSGRDMNSGSLTSRDSSSSSQMDQGSSGSGDMNRPGSSTSRSSSQSQSNMGGSRGTISGTDIPNTSGLSDREYVMRLRSTHREALEKAEMQLKQGKSAEEKSMARNTIASQKAEISKLDRWLATNR